MRLLEFRASNILMRDLINALSHYFDMERVGGDSRIYSVGSASGVIFMLNNSLRALGLIYSKDGGRVQSVAVWRKINLDAEPDFVADVPPEAQLVDVIEPLVKFIKKPREGLIESVLTEERNISPEEFIKLARSFYGDKAHKLTANDLDRLADRFSVDIPPAIRLNPALKIDDEHWNLNDDLDPSAAVAKHLDTKVSEPDPDDSDVQQLAHLAKVKTLGNMQRSGSLVIMGRKPNGEIFNIPGIDDVVGQLERLLAKNTKVADKSSMERQYEELEKKVTMIAGGTSEFIKSLLITGAPSQGKALALDTPIPTPNGWTTMGALTVGDEVFDENGEICRVTFATPIQYNRQCFKVMFDDGTTIIADADHRWLTDTLASRRSAARVEKRRQKLSDGFVPKPNGRDQSYKRELPSVKTTLEIAESLVAGGKWNHHISCAKPVQYREMLLPIDPYVLGYWLGDGTRNAPTITVGNQDIREATDLLAKYEPVSVRETSRAGIFLLRMCPLMEGNTREGNSFKNRLQYLGVVIDKHIPDAYLMASYDQRLALLQGLMDSDGTVSPRGDCEFSVSDQKLAIHALELIRSLGIKAQMKAGVTASERLRYRIHFSTPLPVFRLERKLSRQMASRNKSNGYRTIVGCEPVASVPVRCITVDSPSHLFLCSESFIPTHNTFRVMKAIKEMGLTAGEDYVTKKGKISAKSLYRVLIQQLNGLAVFDDCDSVVKDVNGVNMLKGALDTGAERTVDYDVDGLMNTDAMPFEKRGKIVGAMSAILRGVPTEAELSLIEEMMESQAAFRAKAKATKKTSEPKAAETTKRHPGADVMDLSAGWDDDAEEDDLDDGDDDDKTDRVKDHNRIREAEAFVMNNLPNKIDYYGRVIFISNMSPEEWKEVGDGAIISRAFSQNMDFPDEEMLDYIEKIKEHIKTPRLTEEDKEEVLAYLRELWVAGKVKKRIDFRLVQSSFDLFLLNGWKELVEANCQ